MFRIGLDVGSTTAKIVVLNDEGSVVYSSYRRHLANVQGAIKAFLEELKSTLTTEKFTLSITGSVGLGVSEKYNIPFVQEVIAASEFTKKVHPEISTIIDIGGEDAKIVYMKDGQVSDLRMNGNCAGGTGAFIDQMALCLGVDVTDMDEDALRATCVVHKTIFTFCYFITAVSNISSKIFSFDILPGRDVLLIFHIRVQDLFSQCRDL